MTKSEIVKSLYDAYGTDSGILFGIAEKSIVETIVAFTLVARGEKSDAGWISVDEKLPSSMDSDVDDKILGWDNIQKKVHKCAVQDVRQMKTRFTHWQPLPEPPQSKNKEG